VENLLAACLDRSRHLAGVALMEDDLPAVEVGGGDQPAIGADGQR